MHGKCCRTHAGRVNQTSALLPASNKGEAGTPTLLVLRGSACSAAEKTYSGVIGAGWLQA